MLSKKKVFIVFILGAVSFACGPATNQTPPTYSGVPGYQSSALASSLVGGWNVTSIQCGGRNVQNQRIIYYFNNNTGTMTTSSGGQMSLVISYPSATQITMQQASSYGSGYGSGYNTGYNSGYGTSTGVGTIYTFNVSGLNSAGTAGTVGSTMILTEVNQTFCQSLGTTGNATISMSKVQ